MEGTPPSWARCQDGETIPAGQAALGARTGWADLRGWTPPSLPVTRPCWGQAGGHQRERPLGRAGAAGSHPEVTSLCSASRATRPALFVIQETDKDDNSYLAVLGKDDLPHADKEAVQVWVWRGARSCHLTQRVEDRAPGPPCRTGTGTEGTRKSKGARRPSRKTLVFCVFPQLGAPSDSLTCV